MNEKSTTIQLDGLSAVLDAGAALNGINIPSDANGTFGIPFVVVPSGYDIKDLEHLFPAPFRKKIKQWKETGIRMPLRIFLSVSKNFRSLLFF